MACNQIGPRYLIAISRENAFELQLINFGVMR